MPTISAHGRNRGPNACKGKSTEKKRKAKKVGRSFCKKSGFMRIEEAFFDTEGKKKGERVKRM